VKYITQKSIKGRTIVEYLAYHLVEEYQPLYFLFPNEDILVVEEDDGEAINNSEMTLMVHLIT